MQPHYWKVQLKFRLTLQICSESIPYHYQRCKVYEAFQRDLYVSAQFV